MFDFSSSITFLTWLMEHIAPIVFVWLFSELAFRWIVRAATGRRPDRE